jgi:hypothetical protein
MVPAVASVTAQRRRSVNRVVGSPFSQSSLPFDDPAVSGTPLYECLHDRVCMAAGNLCPKDISVRLPERRENPPHVIILRAGADRRLRIRVTGHAEHAVPDIKVCKPELFDFGALLPLAVRTVSAIRVERAPPLFGLALMATVFIESPISSHDGISSALHVGKEHGQAACGQTRP